MKPEIMTSASPEVRTRKKNTLGSLFLNSPLLPFSNIEPVGTQVHVQALDEIVSVNSCFTAAVFIGISFTNPSAQGSLVSKCEAGEDFVKYLLIFEVVAFSCYLYSSLIAQGLKLLIVILHSNEKHESIGAEINSKILKAGMFLTAIGTIAGTTCLTFSIVILIQMRLGVMFCNESKHWSLWGAVPVIAFVATGLVTFISSVVYSLST